MSRVPPSARVALLVPLWLLAAACSRGGGAAAAPEKPLVGGLGKRLAAGPVADLKLSKDGQWATFLRNPKRPAIRGVSPKMALGELGVVSLKDGALRFVAQGVSNRPGSVLFSPDARWLLFVDGYNAADESGTLQTLLLDAKAEPEVRGKAVSFVSLSPKGDAVAFVDGGQLKVASLAPGSVARTVAPDVSTTQFTPDGRQLLVHRRAAVGGALLLVSVEGGRTAKLGDDVGDWTLSADGKHLAYTVASASVKNGRDLWVSTVPDGKPVRIASGVGAFAFSPDGRSIARIQREKAQSVGDLFVGPVAGGAARRVAERVGEFSFAPGGDAVAALANYDDNQRWGRLTVAALPAGAPVELGVRVSTFVWSPDGKHLAFNARVFQPLPSVDLWLHEKGKPAAVRVMQNVYGYDFGPGGALLFRAECTRETRSCNLERLDPTVPDAKPRAILEGVFGFRASEAGNRLLVTYARTDGDTYDAAVLNLKTNERKTLEEHVLLPVLFANPEGSRAVYLVSEGERSGFYVCDQVP